MTSPPTLSTRSSTPPTAPCSAAGGWTRQSTAPRGRACWPSVVLRDTAYPHGLPVGEAVATAGGNLPARWVIHTVGPNRHAGQSDPALLASCFESSLRVAVEVGARSLAFPAVSAGVYGWDAAEVARIALTAVRESAHLAELDLVRFVLFSATTHAAFIAEMG